MAAPGPFILYSANKHILSLRDMTLANVKIGLVTSAYTPNTEVDGDTTWDDLPEIAAGNGYSAGGAVLTGMFAVPILEGYKFTSNTAAWTAVGGEIPAWRYAVMHINGTFGGVVNPLIGYFLGDSTPQDVPATASGESLALNCPTDGWFDAT
jgi:hypothetical protein